MLGISEVFSYERGYEVRIVTITVEISWKLDVEEMWRVTVHQRVLNMRY